MFLDHGCSNPSCGYFVTSRGACNPGSTIQTLRTMGDFPLGVSSRPSTMHFVPCTDATRRSLQCMAVIAELPLSGRLSNEELLTCHRREVGHDTR
jgi:hypothetical protein